VASYQRKEGCGFRVSNFGVGGGRGYKFIIFIGWRGEGGGGIDNGPLGC
jgi:hypothetical protein